MRANLTAEQRQAAAEKAAGRFLELPIFQQSKHIACYLAFGDEIDTLPIINQIWQAGKICYLPTLAEGRMLHFARYQPEDELGVNQLGIQEPMNTARKLAPEKLDLVISPLIAFDKQGHRLGTGGGYYDRTFAFMYNRPEGIPKMYGLGFACQQAESLPCDPWDIILNGIITEDDIITATRQSTPLAHE